VTAPVAKYADAFAALDTTGAPGWLADLRSAALAEFNAVGFPTTRNEDWHFTSVTPIAERSFRSAKPSAAPTLADVLAATVGDLDHR
jgi:Fe-S cluster assembly protein SufD